jgi:hypothetical protein
MTVTINTDNVTVTPSARGDKYEISYYEKHSDGPRFTAVLSRTGATVRLVSTGRDGHDGFIVLPAELVQILGHEMDDLQNQLAPLSAQRALDMAQALAHQWPPEIAKLEDVALLDGGCVITVYRVRADGRYRIADLRDYHTVFAELLRDQTEWQNEMNRTR